MSTEAVFIVYIIADIETNKGTTSLEVTDLEKGSSEDNDSGNAIENDIHKNPIEMLADNTRQGPLASGGYLHIGSFDDLICRIGRSEGLSMDGHVPQGDLEFISA